MLSPTWPSARASDLQAQVEAAGTTCGETECQPAARRPLSRRCGGPEAVGALQLGQGDPARALDGHDAEGPQQVLEVVELVGRAVEADMSSSWPTSTMLAAEDLDQLDAPGPALGVGACTVTSSSSRSTESRRGELGDLDHVDQLVELLDHLLERRRLRRRRRS